MNQVNLMNSTELETKPKTKLIYQKRTNSLTLTICQQTYIFNGNTVFSIIVTKMPLLNVEQINTFRKENCCSEHFNLLFWMINIFSIESSIMLEIVAEVALLKLNIGACSVETLYIVALSV